VTETASTRPHEDKAGAPATPGLGKSTVAANNVEAMADMRSPAQQPRGSSSKLLGGGSGGKNTGIEGVSRTLSKSLESRRSSTGSKKAMPASAANKSSALAIGSETNSLRAVATDSPGEGASSAVGSPGNVAMRNEGSGNAAATEPADAAQQDTSTTSAAAPQGEQASEVRRDIDRLLSP
jgi:autophagy-related protein 11